MTTPWQPPDPWLVRYLEQLGRWNPDGLGRGLHPRACVDCGRTTLAGLDAEVAAITIYLHPHPLTARGEAVARILEWPTYALVRRYPNQLQADQRDAAAIRQRPPSVIDVVAPHHCTIRLPVWLYKAPPLLVPRDAPPPF